MRFYLPFFIFIALACFLAIGLNLDPSKVSSPLINKPMPAFSATSLTDEQQVITEKDFSGTPALINVWASWCVACLDEHHLLMALAERDSFPVYGINYKDTREKALEWLKKEGNPFALTIHDENGQIGLNWGVYGVPETYLVDADGVIRYKHVGPLSEESVKEKILPLMVKIKWDDV